MNRRRVQQRRPKPWTLARVRRECPSAAAVYLALLDLAAERRTSLLTPTRKLLASMTGIKKHQTISQALTTLTRAGWIDLNHIPSSNRGQRTTLLRLILRRMHRKTVLTGKLPYAPKNGAYSKHRKTVHDSPTERGRHKTPPPPASAEASAGRPETTQPTEQTTQEHPAARTERERLEAIRTQRETRERTEQNPPQTSRTIPSVA